jgi:hypothetical protein
VKCKMTPELELLCFGQVLFFVHCFNGSEGQVRGSSHPTPSALDSLGVIKSLESWSR